ILVSAVEGQRDEAPPLRHDDRAAADLVHGHEIIFPALQGTDGPVEESRRDFFRFERLKSPRAPRQGARKAQDHAGAADVPALPGPAGEITDFQLQFGQKLTVRTQAPSPPMQAVYPACCGIVLTLC